jgi:hypothetical protein
LTVRARTDTLAERRICRGGKTHPQSGATISGDAPEVVVVKTDSVNHGHSSTGTVVGIVCRS